MKYGRKKDRKDPRDSLYRLKHSLEIGTTYPPVHVDLRPRLPPVFNQELQDCGPTSMDALLCMFFPGMFPPGFSRLQIYYDVRLLEGSVLVDDGVETRDLFRVLLNTGALPETAWPYDPDQLKANPPTEGSFYKIASYSRLTRPGDFLACLANDRAFILGFDVYESFESDQTAASGVVVHPKGEEAIVGGHDVLVCGYDQDFRNNPALKAAGVDPSSVDGTALLFRNSWGPNWGIDGYGWMPITYPGSTADCWTATPAPVPNATLQVNDREEVL